VPTTNPVPRRWNVELDGIRWLPRLIDKARMREAGALGAYLLGHSPVDAAFLLRAGISTEAFAALVTDSPNDEAVLAALRARGWDEARVRRWSERFPQTYWYFIPLWDVDDGYVQPSPMARMGVAVFRRIEEPLMSLVRVLRRAP